MRRWRTQVHVLGVFATGYITVRLPGWTSQETVVLTGSDLPPFTPEADQRYHAKVNLGAEAAEDLAFSDWEAS